MHDDAELLRRYVSENSQEAFTELVNQHVGLVYHTALRYLNGDVHTAEDVAQKVFADLAGKARNLTDRPLIAGWLHTATRFAVLDHRRSEQRRTTREKEAHAMEEQNRDTHSIADWERLRPVIDDALHELDAVDREAVLLRYFEGRDFAAIGTQLELSADGARSRVDRALDRMQPLLVRRGVTSSAGAIGAALAANAAQITPAGLAASVAGVVIGSTSTVSTVALGALQFMKISSALLAGSLAANAVLGVIYVNDTHAAPVPAAPAIAPAATATGSVLAFKAIYSPDPAVFLAHLLAANIPESVRRALIEAAIDEQFRAREEALLPKRTGTAWWQWQDTTLPMQTSLALLDLHREKAKLRQQLLGPDPKDIAADQDDPIAPEKREQVRIITEDYSAMMAAIPKGPFRSATETAALAGLKEQRAKDLADLLTPAELAAYEDRTWDQLPYLKQQLHAFEPTPEEFAVLRDALIERQKPGADGGIYRDPMEEENARLLATFGESRFDQYYISKSFEFRALASLLERTGEPQENIIPVYNLWKNAEAETHAIEATPDLNAEQKVAAVKDLGTTTRAEILRELGPQAGPAYIDAWAGQWLGYLDDGDVITFSTDGFEGHRAGTPAAKTLRTSIRLQGKK